MWPAGEPESPTSGPPGAVIAPIDQADEVVMIQSKMSDLSEGIQQRCKIEQGLVAMVVQLNDSGQVVQKVSSKSKGNVNIDCIYKVLKSRSFERRTSGLIEVKYQAKW